MTITLDTVKEPWKTYRRIELDTLKQRVREVFRAEVGKFLGSLPLLIGLTKRTLNLLISSTGGGFTTWSKVLLKLGSYPPADTRRQGTLSFKAYISWK